MKITKTQLKELISEQIQKFIKEDFTKAQEKSISDKLERLSNELVPDSGVADTIEGEMVRAINRIWYRYENNGDYWYRGYGKETAMPSVKWLKTQSPVAKQLKSILKSYSKNETPEHLEYSEKDKYLESLIKAGEIIVKYIESKKGNYTKK